MYEKFVHSQVVNTIFTSSWPTAAVFDFDGLIAATEHCWHTAYAALLARRGQGIDDARLATLAGASVRKAADSLEVPTAELRSELRRSFEQATIAPLPGVASVVRRLHARMPLAVATNGPHDVVSAALRRLGLDNAFEAVLSGEAQPREKPAPDVYLAACRALGVDPSQAIAFEDSAIGVTAARRAGLLVVQVARGASLRTDADLGLERIDDPALLAFLALERVATTAEPAPMTTAERPR